MPVAEKVASVSLQKLQVSKNVKKKSGFSRRSRLTERHQFVRLFDSPNVYKARCFIAFWKKNSEQGARLGITIKGRLSSVWRARIKRVIREWFRNSKEQFGNNDINIVIKIPSTLNRGFLDQLCSQLSRWKFPEC